MLTSKPVYPVSSQEPLQLQGCGSEAHGLKMPYCVVVKNSCSGDRRTWIQTFLPPPSSFVTLNKLFQPSKSQFPHQENANNATFLIKLFKDKMRK
jgi:hypothetical protein